MDKWLTLINTGMLLVLAVLCRIWFRDLHIQINSRMSELLETTRRAATAVGVEQGRQAAISENKENKDRSNERS